MIGEPPSQGDGGSGLFLRLPATSANLGPGFDTLALALALYLEIEARPAAAFSIKASGRNVDLCSQVEGNLLLTVYQETVRRGTGRVAPPLSLVMRNAIPLGMGCGSSAASRLAGVALAAHFGGLGWSREQVLAEACRLEGHPDNAAACWLGGFAASGWEEPGLGTEQGLESQHRVAAVSIAPPAAWSALLVLPAAPLATTASRAVLPDRYNREDVVLNLQRVALLTAAFATGRAELLRSATADSLHQPYRSHVCPLLPLLLPLAGQHDVLSVTLSGAGPAVLLLLGAQADEARIRANIDQRVHAAPAPIGPVEYVHCALGCEAAIVSALEAG